MGRTYRAQSRSRGARRGPARARYQQPRGKKRACAKACAPAYRSRTGRRGGRRRAACSRTATPPASRRPSCPCAGRPGPSARRARVSRRGTHGSKYATAHTIPAPVCCRMCRPTVRAALPSDAGLRRDARRCGGAGLVALSLDDVALPRDMAVVGSAAATAIMAVLR